MRKRIVEFRDTSLPADPEAGWLNLSQIATVEVTSEDEHFPIETAFTNDGGSGWRAARPGKQVIRIILDEPVAIGRIRLCFHETESERTQEFSLSWCPAAGGSMEIVRQQWNFNRGAVTEIEDYALNLDAVAGLELAIQPDISSKNGVATLSSWMVGGASR